MQFLPLSEDGSLDAEWLSEKLGKAVESAKVRGMDTMGGMAGSFNLLDVVLKSGSSGSNNSSNNKNMEEETDESTAGSGAEGAVNAEDSESTTLVIKTIPEANLQTSVTMNLWREANFYNELAAKLPEGLVPHVWFAKGDPETGQKVGARGKRKRGCSVLFQLRAVHESLCCGTPIRLAAGICVRRSGLNVRVPWVDLIVSTPAIGRHHGKSQLAHPSRCLFRAWEPQQLGACVAARCDGGCCRRADRAGSGGCHIQASCSVARPVLAVSRN